MCRLRDAWIARLVAEHPEAGWAPLRTELNDEDLELLGLPPRDWLLSHRFPEPTMVSRDGTAEPVELPSLQPTRGTLGPTVATYAGLGCFGIRPGAWLLLITGNSIGWCSMAHVYGTPGNYQISTAGHCGKVGDVATVIAALGNRAGLLNPILLDFGKFAKVNDGGLGKDWALISIDAAWQSLVSPTMCFWGGPRGMYTKVGATVTLQANRLPPSVTLNADPFLAQAIVQYGHGTGVGTGGTPRAGAAIAWMSSHFMFVGAITPGDSGSGSNTLTGDTVGATMEAAGINTHLWIDVLMRSGIGIMGGTRATQVPATLANGQIVPYPVPAPGLP